MPAPPPGAGGRLAALRCRGGPLPSRGAPGRSRRAARGRVRGAPPRPPRSRARGLEGAGGRPAEPGTSGPVGSAETSRRRGGGRDVEVADRRSAKLEAVRARPGRLAEISGDLAHVRALGALHRDRRPLSRLVEAPDLEAPDRHMAGRRRHRLPRSHPRVGAPAVDLDRRGGRDRLEHLAGHPGRGRGDGRRIGRGSGRREISLRVERRRHSTELHHGLVALVEAGEVRGQACRPARQDEQEAGREGVERALHGRASTRAPAAVTAGRRTSSVRRAYRRGRGRSAAPSIISRRPALPAGRRPRRR